MSKKCYVLLSGGQDSTTCLYWAKTQFDEVIAIGFDYGQKHKHELKQAQQIATLANVPYEIIDITGLLSGSSLTDFSQDVTQSHKKNDILPSTFTAGRNMLFLTLVASKGFNEDVFDIVTGVCQTDYSGYPDCRRNFIDSLEQSLNLAMLTDDSKSFKIHTPLMYLTKAETWKLAKELDIVEIVRTMTLTDYNGSTQMNEWGMGNIDNPASELRAKGYFKAKENGWV